MVDLFDDSVPQNGAEWMRAMVRQLELTEKGTVAQQEAFQKRTLLTLLQHAYEHVPAYKNRLKPLIRFDGSLDLAGWQDVPVLHRDEAAELGNEMVANLVPDDHLPVFSGYTSGSTTAPFQFKFTQFQRSMMACVGARHLNWHGFDFSKPLASIKFVGAENAAWPKGKEEKYWGAQGLSEFSRGPHLLLNMGTPIEQQVEWLRRKRPAYLISFASNLRSIALAIQNDGGEPLNLEGVMSYSEMLSDDMRELVTSFLGSKLVDCYSTRECGFVAGQSPSTNNHLIRPEFSLVEVLDKDYKPCETGQPGLVVVTVLHNFAQPFIRYAPGDYAILGEPDHSGLPFPVISKILGRSGSLFRFSENRYIQPDFRTSMFIKTLGAQYWQVAQVEDDHLEVRFAPDKLKDNQIETDLMSAYICESLDMDLKITYRQVPELKNSRKGKHEDYVCEL